MISPWRFNARNFVAIALLLSISPTLVFAVASTADGQWVWLPDQWTASATLLELHVVLPWSDTLKNIPVGADSAFVYDPTLPGVVQFPMTMIQDAYSAVRPPYSFMNPGDLMVNWPFDVGLFAELSGWILGVFVISIGAGAVVSVFRPRSR